MGSKLGIFDGEDRLDAPVEVAFHQVGAAEVGPTGPCAAVTEVVDPAMLQEASHHADHPDRVAPAGHARSQAADPTHDEVDPHAGTGGGVEATNDLLVDEGVHLKDQPALAGPPVGGDLLTDGFQESLPQLGWGNPEPPVPLLLREARQCVEELRDIGPKILPRRQETEILVDAGRGGVVVAGGQVNVAT